MICIKFHPHHKGSLRGFADLELPSGLIIRGCTLFEKDGREWVSFPSRSYTDKDGATKWQPLVEFAETAKAERAAFQRQALDAIHDVAGSGDRLSVAGGTTDRPSRNGADDLYSDPIPF